MKKKHKRNLAIGGIALIPIIFLLMWGFAGWNVWKVLTQAFTDFVATFGIAGNYTPYIVGIVGVVILTFIAVKLKILKANSIKKMLKKMFNL